MSLSNLFGQVEPRKVLVVGDFFLDTYTIGNTSRISPEAPVAVVKVEKTEHRPGGAGNVALNLVSLGMQVVALGRVGPDMTGERVLATLDQEGIETHLFVEQKQYMTPIKNRIISSNQQIVRVDHEEVTSVPDYLQKEMISKIPIAFDGVDVVAISDYGKGFLSDTFLAELIYEARERKIPVITDPKGIDYSKYAGSTILKPNFGEAVQASGLERTATLREMGEKILRITHAEQLIVTRSEKGMWRFSIEGEEVTYPVRAREVKDVTGAGDTVLAIVAFGVANGFDLDSTCTLANIAAGIAVEQVGCARVTLSELADRLLEDDVENKVFSDEHLYALQEVLKGKNLIVLGLTAKAEISAPLFRAIHSLAKKDRELLVYLQDPSPSADLIQALTSHADVDYLIHHGESFRKLCALVNPSEIYVLREGELQQIEELAGLVS